MQVLLLSIVAKCGVYTHVRELALYMKKLGLEPVLGLIHNQKTTRMFKLKEEDQKQMQKSLNGTNYFFYESNDDLFERIRNRQIEVVHAHSPLVFSTGIEVSKKLNIPFVITLHSVLNWSKLYATTLGHADCIIAVGPEAAKSAGSTYQEKVQTIFNGVDIDYYKPNKDISLNGPLRIMWIGRTNGPAANGAKSLDQAIGILRKKGISIEAKMIGHANGTDPKNMGAYGWVHDPLPYLRESHIVFGRGRALREAMACGNIGFLIGQGYGGMVRRKWFENGKQPQLSGSLKHGYDNLDVSVIVNDLLYLYWHRNLLREGSKIARKIAEEHFDVKKMVEETISVYHRAIENYHKRQSE